MSDPYPDDMGQALKARLRYDVSVYGTSFYRETDDGYERVNPEGVVYDDGGPPDGVTLAGRYTNSPRQYYGKSLLESARERAEESEVVSSGHRTLWGRG